MGGKCEGEPIFKRERSYRLRKEVKKGSGRKDLESLSNISLTKKTY